MNDHSQPPPTPPPCSGQRLFITVHVQSLDDAAFEDAAETVEIAEGHRDLSFSCRDNGLELQISFASEQAPDDVIMRQLLYELEEIDGVTNVSITRK